MSLRTLFSVLAIASFVLSGCELTRQVRSVERSGFLGDYSQLKPGADGEAQLVYVDPRADFKAYDAILIDSVALWRTAGAAALPKDEEQALTDYLYQSLHDELSQDYRIVDRPGPRVLRLRVAITEAKGANVVGNAVTSIIPQLRLISTAAGVSTDTQALVGKAGIEGELTDSVSGRQLMAAVDARAGAKQVRGGLAKWSDVKNAFDFWAQRLRARLKQERGG